MITKFNKFLNESQEIVDNILDKINQYGIDKLTKKEKEYLDKFSRGEDLSDYNENNLKGKSFVSDLMGIPPFEFIYDKTEFDDDSVKHYGDFIFNNETFTGYISCNLNGDYEYAQFFNPDDYETDLYTVAEGLEHEIDNFFIDDVCPFLN